MSEPEVQIIDDGPTEETAGADVEMSGAAAAEADNGDGAEEKPEDETVAEEEEEEKEEDTPPSQVFIDYLKSPIVELLVGEGDQQTILNSHQALLTKSPYFKEAVEAFGENPTSRRIPLTSEQIDAVGCFLQYMYTGEYFPRRLSSDKGLEHDPTQPQHDESGEPLLKHARVYTLAHKLGISELKSLAMSKIHLIHSTAKGEIAYARYVYANTAPDDISIRKPVARFWSLRSHVLRHEAEEEFRKMCLEFPQFGFDVLSLVLDAREKGKGERDHPEKLGSARKRARQG
ncbi:MAG: hypothetical protein M1835_006003 [Candelina submexicana]|nr:MAG: hypothetical protein M1835_006003 [Candelina submexicana]